MIGGRNEHHASRARFRATRFPRRTSSGLSSAAQAQGEVNIYSYREPQLIDPLLKAFTDKTGIKANVVYAAAGLNERLAAEGQNSPADLLFTVDAGRLSEAKDAGLTQPVDSSALKQVMPAQFRDPGNHWFGLTMRSRVVYASKERVKQDAITYEELADPKWKGKLCIRSGQHVYNTSLIATMIAHKGEAATEAWLKGVKANLAHKPAGGDREQARDIFSGKCDLALGNTYYMALMMKNEKNPEQKQWAGAIKIAVPQRRRPRQPCQHLRHGDGQARAQQGQCAQADGVPGLRGGAEDLRHRQQRVSGEPAACRRPTSSRAGAR